jgi:hypothetical protein
MASSFGVMNYGRNGKKSTIQREAIQTINFEVSNTKKGGIGRCRHRCVPGTRCLSMKNNKCAVWHKEKQKKL